MARRLRLHVPGGFYHVTIRGNHRMPIFFRHSDRDLLDRIVADSLNQLGARLHAYCWMTNHMHLLVQMSDAPLGRLVLKVASAYARTVQMRLETTGHLFERRYHSVLVDADRYLLTLIRYIHQNPVRGGLVEDPAAYPWSSHRVYLGLSERPWVTTSFAMRLLSPSSDRARSNYLELMNCPETLRWGSGTLVPHPEQPQVLGDDNFIARFPSSIRRNHANGTLNELLQECSNRFHVTPQALTSPVRNRQLARARAWLGHEAIGGGVASVCGVARLLGRTEGAIRQAMSRYPAEIVAAGRKSG